MKTLQIVIGILIFVVIGVMAVLQQVRIVELGYQLHAAESETDELAESNRQLRARIAKLRNPGRLAQMARVYRLPIHPPEADPEWDANAVTRPLPQSPVESPAVDAGGGESGETEGVAATDVRRDP